MLFCRLVGQGLSEIIFLNKNGNHNSSLKTQINSDSISQSVNMNTNLLLKPIVISECTQLGD